MTEKRFKYHMGLICEKKDGEYNLLTIQEITDLLNALYKENMNNGAEITRFKLIVSDIVDDLEKQAKNEEAIVISMDYVDWIKSELDLKLNGLKR